MLSRVLLVRIIFQAGFFCLLAAFPSSDQAIAASENTAGTDQAYLYEHPRQGYFIGIPVNVIFQDRGDERGIALKSRKGYQVTVQTNATDPGQDLMNMLSRLESKYLGNGKPWSRKFEQSETRVAGLNAVDALYEGAGVRVRVIIVRGSRLDYVFIFLASPLNFQKLVTEFDWVLANFRAAPGDYGKTPVSMGNEQNFKIFSGPGLGYTVNYPPGWIAERQGNHVLVIGGKPGTPAYFATINLQNIKKPDTRAEPDKAVSTALRDLKIRISSTDRHAQFSDEGPYEYLKPGVRLAGGQFTVVYDQGKIRYKQWTIVLPRPNEDIIHIWSYAAPVDSFFEYGAVAKSVLESWTIDPGP